MGYYISGISQVYIICISGIYYKYKPGTKKIVNKLEIQDRIFKTITRECFVTFKDHKADFKRLDSSTP